MNNEIKMNHPIDPDDVIGVIKEFMNLNAGDEATESILLAVGASILGVSDDTMMELINK